MGADEDECGSTALPLPGRTGLLPLRPRWVAASARTDVLGALEAEAEVGAVVLVAVAVEAEPGAPCTTPRADAISAASSAIRAARSSSSGARTKST